MLTKIEFDRSDFLPGEERLIRAWTDAGILYFSIKCFQEPPSPAQLKACDTCGDLKASSGDPIKVIASADVFRNSGGFLLISIRDSAGSPETIRVNVKKK